MLSYNEIVELSIKNGAHIYNINDVSSVDLEIWSNLIKSEKITILSEDLFNHLRSHPKFCEDHSYLLPILSFVDVDISDDKLDSRHGWLYTSEGVLTPYFNPNLNFTDNLVSLEYSWRVFHDK